MLSTAATPNSLETNYELVPNVQTERGMPAGNSKEAPCVTCKTTLEVDLDEIVYIEEEAPVELGFDTREYLPEGFDPYSSYVDLGAIEFIEQEEEEGLGFDTAAWLPETFDPYAAPADIQSVSFMEEEEALLVPEVDTRQYLPEGFDPYAPYFASQQAYLAASQL